MSWFWPDFVELTAAEQDWILKGSLGIVKLLERATPSTLSGFGQLYTKSDHNLYYLNSLGTEIQLGSGGSGGAGTVTTVSVVTNQGVSGSVANATTTPAITLTLGALTGVTSINGLIITANTGTVTTGTWNGTKIGLAYGGTNADLSATGGTSQYLKQASSGAAITVGTIPASDIASGAALTKTDDTNVTLTLGGAPSTALLAAASLTLGWTGTLAVSRGGTGGGSASITLFNNITGLSAAGTTGTTSTNLVFSTSPTLVTPVLGVASATSLATSAASPLLLTNGQLVTIALTSQTVGAATLTIPNFASVSDTFTFNTLAATLLNKTLDTSVAKGTWTASGTWTIPAVTLGGTVSGGGNNLNNIIIGAVTPLAGTFTVVTASKAGLPLDITNSTDATTNQIVKISGTNATRAANDLIYASFFLANSVGTQKEFGRMNIKAPVVTSTTEDGSFIWSVMSAGTLTDTMTLTKNSLSIGTSNALTTGTIELGATSDTTLARVSAGVVSIEGITIGTSSNTLTLTNKTLTSSTNVLGGVTMTLGSDADGDMYYRSSGVLTRLAKGTQNTLLRQGATNPGWSIETWATPGTSGNVLTSDGTNWTSAAAAGGGDSTITVMCMPNWYVTFAAASITISSNTTLNIGMLIVPCKITVNAISVDVSGVNTAGKLNLAVFTADGATQKISVQTATISANASVTTAVSGVVLGPGIYWFAIQPVSTASFTVRGFTTNTNYFNLKKSTSTYNVVEGTLTATASTMPSTITPTSVVAGDSIIPVYRLDN